MFPLRSLASLVRYDTRRNFFLTYGIILLFGVNGLLIRSIKLQDISPPIQLKLFYTSLVMMALFWEALRVINRCLDHFMPFEKGITSRIVVQLTLGSTVGLMIRYLIYLFGEPYLPFKLDELFIVTTWFIYTLLPTLVNFGFFTVFFMERWKDSVVLAARLEREKTQVQFDNLKNQLNPHFLFNALASLNSLIFTNQKLASAFLQQLSKVYRYLLQNRERGTVALREELSFIKHYISLLETRFCKSIYFDFGIADEHLDDQVIPVTLQILIENAIKHNIVDQSRPLRISLTVRDGYLEVSNNIQRRKQVETANGQGLENLKSLYGLVTQKPLIVQESKDIFQVMVPLLQ